MFSDLLETLKKDGGFNYYSDGHEVWEIDNAKEFAGPLEDTEKYSIEPVSSGGLVEKADIFIVNNEGEKLDWIGTVLKERE